MHITAIIFIDAKACTMYVMPQNMHIATTPYVPRSYDQDEVQCKVEGKLEEYYYGYCWEVVRNMENKL